MPRRYIECELNLERPRCRPSVVDAPADNLAVTSACFAEACPASCVHLEKTKVGEHERPNKAGYSRSATPAGRRCQTAESESVVARKIEIVWHRTPICEGRPGSPLCVTSSRAASAIRP